MNLARKIVCVSGMTIFAAIVLTTAAIGSRCEASPARDVLSLGGNDWLIATDTKNVGQQEEWFRSPLADAKKAKVPFIPQDSFPSYYGLVWYCCGFNSPVNGRAEGRYLLRFWAGENRADFEVISK